MKNQEIQMGWLEVFMTRGGVFDRLGRGVLWGLLMGIVIVSWIAPLQADEKPEQAAIAPVAEVSAVPDEKKSSKTFDALSKASATCLSCHVDDNRGLYQQWGRSKHYGANVGCYECHRAEPNDPDAYMHKKFLISIIVSPKDCGRCHEKEYQEFSRSVHADSGAIEGSPAYNMAKVTQGIPGDEAMEAAALHGCRQCHGSTVRVKASGKLDPLTWPNTGIGRINPDGSKGACTACHQRHEFSQSQARRPEACGKCHRGSAHAQKEIYEESKHSINFQANSERMNLQSPKWIPGEDYDSGPTCATCHMSATATTPLSHDVGERISWDLCSAVSRKVGEGGHEDHSSQGANWEKRRDKMKEVCISCHTEKIIENFYEQFDNVVELYNTKFGEPGDRLMAVLAEDGLRTAMDFDEEIEWTWFKIWHQAGRRVRHGASMMAPDYVQWQGFYEIAELFYTGLLPQAEALIQKGLAEGKGKKAQEILEEIKRQPGHAWRGKASEIIKP